MNELERRLKELAARLTQWWGSESKTARHRQRRAERAANLRAEASTRAQQAASRLQDFRESDRGQRAASALNDLRDSGPAKRAEAVIQDLRASDAGKRAESALTDLRQREPVKKAEENARKVMHDLFSGGSSAPSAGDPAGGTPAS
jgi:membrane protein involved in colicin uptake